MSMIEVTTEYGAAILPSKVLAEGIKRAEEGHRDNPQNRQDVTESEQVITKRLETI